MGYLQYGGRSIVFSFDDRTLAHLQVVFSAKLRRKESFFFHWDAEYQGRSVWITPKVPMVFVFEGSRAPTLNAAWIAELVESSYSSNGLTLHDEPRESAIPSERAGKVSGSARARRPVG
ncbi:ATP-dependent DNA ligase [Glaciibacter flavus]|uniref:ATP-dependent DNA ligase n=1 Tax=Orlajensenia flava TaxID=2565934 RepID=A0A4S4FQT7_9MICO|nr:ATP-dependent DNA ligase [Glaciibacter flavus]